MKKLIAVLISINLVLLAVVQGLAIVRLWPKPAAQTASEDIESPSAQADHSDTDVRSATPAVQEFSAPVSDGYITCALRLDGGETGIAVTRLTLRLFADDRQIGEDRVWSGADFDMPHFPCSIDPMQTGEWTERLAIESDLNIAEYTVEYTCGDGTQGQTILRYRAEGGDVTQASTDTGTTPVAQEAAEMDLYARKVVNADFGDSWNCAMTLQNGGAEAMRVTQLTLRTLSEENPAGDDIVFEGDRLASVLVSTELPAGASTVFSDNLPVADAAARGINEIDYIFTFSDGSEQVFRFRLEENPAYATGTSGKDLTSLRYDAAFQLEVYPGVYWVPARDAGDSAYTNEEIAALLTLSPEEKQERIHTLYEALQLYEIGGFTRSDDNIFITEDGANWEHHKDGYNAVRTNTGCCASDANWLNYILAGDYDEVGFLAWSAFPSDGHIYNYIKIGEWYYFVDLTPRCVNTMSCPVETGDPADYASGWKLQENIHKARSIEDYVAYYQSQADAPGLMMLYQAEDCLAVYVASDGTRATYTYENVPGVDVRVIWDNPDDSLSAAAAPSPKKTPDYGEEPGYEFGQ